MKIFFQHIKRISFLMVIVGIGIFQELFSQESPLIIKVQALDTETKNGISGIGISILDVGSSITDDQGIAEIPIPANIIELEVVPPVGYDVYSPPDRKFPVPSSEKSILRVWLEIGQITKLRLELDKLTRREMSFRSQLDSLHKVIQTQNENIFKTTGNTDSLSFITEIQRDSITTLKDSIYEIQLVIENTKLGIYSQISSNYNTFLNAILNFTEFLLQAPLAFTNPKVLEDFNQYIMVLNEARDNMHENYLGYVETVEQYWSTGNAVELRKMYDLALEKGYKKVVMPLNDKLVKELRMAWNRQKPRLLAQKSAKKPTKEAIKNLEQVLKELQEKADEILEKLERGI